MSRPMRTIFFLMMATAPIIGCAEAPFLYRSLSMDFQTIRYLKRFQVCHAVDAPTSAVEEVALETCRQIAPDLVARKTTTYKYNCTLTAPSMSFFTCVPRSAADATEDQATRAR